MIPPRRAILLAAAALVLAAGLVAGPAGGAGSEARPEPSQPEFVPPEAALPRLRWPDGSLSVNDRCPVTKTRIARDIAPLFVNGRPVGFC